MVSTCPLQDASNLFRVNSNYNSGILGKQVENFEFFELFEGGGEGGPYSNRLLRKCSRWMVGYLT